MDIMLVVFQAYHFAVQYLGISLPLFSVSILPFMYLILLQPWVLRISFGSMNFRPSYSISCIRGS